MKKSLLAPLTIIFLIALLITLALPVNAKTVNTLQEYNDSLIFNGVSWRSGSSGYYPTFYTGFAPRIEEPTRLHLRMGRGNQARLTAVLDEYAVLTYLYNLKKRGESYTYLMKANVIAPYSVLQVDSFRSIVGSDQYGILATAAAYEKGEISREKLYELSLQTMKALNPGRIFTVKIDFAKTALKWRQNTNLKSLFPAGVEKNMKAAMIATNDLVFGRINATALTGAQIAKLGTLASMAANESAVADATFIKEAAEFFTSLTAGKYDFRVVENGQFKKAFECSAEKCELSYTEFTAIYPVGSVMATSRDKDGNTINIIQESGAMTMVERGYHDVDHIRREPYYGYIPKMDYTMSGNGFHNPAVRTWLSSGTYKWLYGQLGIPKADDTLWIVSRGGVSHGCTRVAAGHMNEMRNVFPSNPKAMTKVTYTGNLSTDYDLFDIDADGNPEVMGVDYLIAYKLRANHGDGYREANGLIEASFKKDQFYSLLYGSKNQYYENGGKYVFTNPQMSYFQGKPNASRVPAFSVKLNGEYPLYEQAYEKDKLQLFNIPKLGISMLQSDGNNHSNKAAQVVRLMGRINGCGPFAKEMKNCWQAGFENEMNSIVSSIR